MAIETNVSELSKLKVLLTNPELIQSVVNSLDKIQKENFKQIKIEEKRAELYEKKNTGVVDENYCLVRQYIYVRDSRTKLNGFNKILEEKPLFMSVSPHNMQDPIDYIWEMLKTATTLSYPDDGSRKKPVTILILGRTSQGGQEEIKENLEPYIIDSGNKEYDISCENRTDPIQLKKITNYFYRIKKQNELLFANIYYLETGSSFSTLSRQDIQFLYETLTDTVIRDPSLEEKKNNPLIVHCNQGLDRAGGYSLAIELLMNFNTVFEGNETEISEKIWMVINDIRKHRSPEAVMDLYNQKVGIYLALACKAIACYEKSLEDLRGKDLSMFHLLIDSNNRFNLEWQVNVLQEKLNTPKPPSLVGSMDYYYKMKMNLVYQNLKDTIQLRIMTENLLQEHCHFLITEPAPLVVDGNTEDSKCVLQ